MISVDSDYDIRAQKKFLVFRKKNWAMNIDCTEDPMLAVLWDRVRKLEQKDISTV